MYLIESLPRHPGYVLSADLCSDAWSLRWQADYPYLFITDHDNSIGRKRTDPTAVVAGGLLIKARRLHLTLNLTLN